MDILPGNIGVKATNFDLDKIRREFPVTKNSLYFNSANRTPIAASVRERVISLYDDAHATGGDKPAWYQEVEIVRSKIATLIGATPNEIAFTKNTSEGLNMAANAIPWQPGDNVLLAEGEHPNNIYAWLGLRSKGLEVRLVPIKEGWINADTFAPYIDERTRVISLSHITFHPGQRHDVEDLAQLCKERGIHLVLDAMQSVGVTNVDVSSLGVSMLAAGCHKGLMALPGHGFFYCNNSLASELHPAYVSTAGIANPPADFMVGLDPFELQSGTRRFEIGNYNYPGIRALNASLDLINSVGVSNIEEHVLSLGDHLINRLNEFDIDLVGPSSPRERRSHINVLDLPASEWFDYLTENKVVVTDARGSIRVAFAMFNSHNEVDQLAHIIKKGLDRNLKTGPQLRQENYPLFRMDNSKNNSLEDTNMEKMSLNLANKLIESSEQEAKKLGVSMVITVVDEGGNLVATHRMDDAWLASIEISQNKAWTSVALKMPTSNLASATVPHAELYGLNTTNSGRIVAFGGGIPLVKNGKVIGAIGVSGSTVPHDVQVAQAGVNAFENLLVFNS